MIMVIILIATVARKSIDVVMAAFLSLFLFSLRFVLPYCMERSSDVISRTIPVIARRRLMSQNPRGNVILGLFLFVRVIFGLFGLTVHACFFVFYDCGFSCCFCDGACYGTCEWTSHASIDVCGLRDLLVRCFVD